MSDKKPNPFQASFLLTTSEKIYVLVVCVLFLLGMAARYFYLKNESPAGYTPAGIEKPEKNP